MEIRIYVYSEIDEFVHKDLQDGDKSEINKHTYLHCCLFESLELEPEKL